MYDCMSVLDNLAGASSPIELILAGNCLNADYGSFFDYWCTQFIVYSD